MAEFDLQALAGTQRYQLLTRLVVPRPIALVSTLDAEGRGNLAPFSFFTLGGNNPPSVVFCPARSRTGASKDTLRNVEETGEFVIAIVTRDIVSRMNQAAWSYEPGDDEFERSGLTRAPARRVRPPRVAESPAALECRLHTVVRHGEGPGSSEYVIGEVLYVHVADALLSDGLPDSARLEWVARLGADYYTARAADALFELKRPVTP